MLIHHFLRHLITEGDLTLVDAHGRASRFVGRPLPGIGPVTLRLHDPALHWRLALNPKLVMGEAWTAGSATLDQGSLYEFLSIGAINTENKPLAHVLAPNMALLNRLQGLNPRPRSHRNAAHHYDLSGEFYGLFLDADRHYSCAYFPTPDAGLEEAQQAKKRLIARKLCLTPGMTVLDIGCGWGGMALHLAREHGARVVGITLSQEQLSAARARAEAEGLADRVSFRLTDYRDMGGQFDRIVSVGMFEHVGVPHYPLFFRKLRELLAEDGVALLHTIGRQDGPGTTNPWIRRYIFPGGYVPSLSEVMPVVERSGLFLSDLEVLRLHYALTLDHWRRRFDANRARVREMYDERFCRMWEFYLVGAEVAFRWQAQAVFQLQLARRQDAVPITRDYLWREETPARPATDRQAAG